MNSALNISVRFAAGGGVSAIDLVQLLRSEVREAKGCPPSDDKEASRLAWEQSCKKMKEMEGVSSKLVGGYSTPVLMKLRQLQALINMRPYSLISHSFRVKYLHDLCKLLPEGERELPKPPPGLIKLGGISNVVPTGEGKDSFQAEFPSWDSLQMFLKAHCDQEGVHLNRDHRRGTNGVTDEDGMLSITFSCFFGGKAKWQERKIRADQDPSDFKRPKAAGVSNKCDCPAFFVARIHKSYAMQLKLIPSSPNLPCTSTINTKIVVTMELFHSECHQPNKPIDLCRFPLDKR